MSNLTNDDDICRARYDRILFASESCSSRENEAMEEKQRGEHKRSTVSTAWATPTHGRKWILELGAMSVLEAEMEDLTVSNDETPSTCGEQQQQKQDAYMSCLHSLLDGHYRNLNRLHVGSSGWNRICADSSAPSTLIGGSSETTTATSTSTGKPGTGMKSNGIGKATANASLRPVKTSTLLSRLPSLARRDAPQVKRHDSRPPSPPHPGPPPNTSDSRSAKHGPPTRQSAPDGARNSPSGGTADAGRGASGTPINGFESSYGALAGQPRRQAMPVDGRDAEASSSNNGSRNRNGGEATNPVFAGGVHAGDPAKASRGSDGSSSGVLNRSGIEFNGSNSFGRGPRAYAEMNRVNMEAGATAPPSITTVAKRNTGLASSSDPRALQQQSRQRMPRHPVDEQQPAAKGFRGDMHGGAAAAEGWAAREPPPPPRGRGVFEYEGRVGAGRGGVIAGHGQQGQGQNAFKTARELRAADIKPGAATSNAGRGRGEDIWEGRGRYGHEQEGRQDPLDNRGAWSGGQQSNGRGARGSAYGQHGHNSGDANGYNGNLNGYGSNSHTSNNLNGQVGNYSSRHESNGYNRYGRDDFEGASSMQGQGMTGPIPPRLPNGSGLVRKRKFVPPGRLNDSGGRGGGGAGKFPGSAALGGGGNPGGVRKDGGGGGGKGGGSGDGEEELPEELQHLDKAMVDKIMQEIQQRGDPVTFDQIAGLEFAKKSVIELVCWPMARPDIFTGLRSLPKGLLLFGPPGTGKTLIGKAIAHQSGATFFSISASSLCSKWIGEGEKMVRTLFAVAAYHQPAVIFIDEVDSMLSMRSADENEASRRLKTEFLIQLDGAGTKASDRVLVVGATNRPQELDEAARRRFVKRLYVPLPDQSGRRQLMNILLKTSVNSLTPSDVEEVVAGTEGFSGADLHALCTEAAMGPVRDLGSSICSIKVSDVPPMEARHFIEARQSMRPSVGAEEITHYLRWNEEFGSFKRA